MERSTALDNVHKDLVTDLAYDYYGRRLATCGADLNVSIWDKDDTGKWHHVTTWQAHKGVVNRVRWAHPEFGQILATCSFDRQVYIWEQQHGSRTETMGWAKKGFLVDSKANVNDIAFAPKSAGLKIATASADGFVRIYEAMNEMKLSSWSLMEEFEGRAKSDADDHGVRCIAWSEARDMPLTLAVGSDLGAHLWQYNETHRKWDRAETSQPMAYNDEIHALDFAAQMGRSFQLLATGSKQGLVKIFKLTPEGQGRRINVDLVAEFDDHHAMVWRVEWDVGGTTLASSGDDGKIRLWQSNFTGEWRCEKTIG